MNTEDLVSVVIPVYNSGKFLQESLDSVINQTYKNIEIICVNDGSTDNSPEILKKYSDKIIIITQKNNGLAHALNTGINVMHGKWFKWFSPDDILYPEAIDILIHEAQNFPENTIIYSNWDIINENGKQLRSFYERNYNDLSVFDFNTRLLDGQQINVNTTLMSSSLFSKDFKMNTSINPILIDYEIFLRHALLYQTKFHLIEKSLIKSRVHEKQLSHQNILKSLKDLEVVKDEILFKIDGKIKKQYLENLRNFRKKKPISRKSMELGLKLISSVFPESLIDKMLVFYLNKIRDQR
jgi:glycosyltransferase involved in cell wall biosynthesis